jgi:hypothetical protein
MLKRERVLSALEQNPAGLTEGQIRTQYRVGNPRAEIHRLRMDGYAVYSNPTINSKGQERTVYRLGRPSRELVAAGWRALAAGL